MEIKGTNRRRWRHPGREQACVQHRGWITNPRVYVFRAHVGIYALVYTHAPAAARRLNCIPACAASVSPSQTPPDAAHTCQPLEKITNPFHKTECSAVVYSKQGTIFKTPP